MYDLLELFKNVMCKDGPIRSRQTVGRLVPIGELPRGLKEGLCSDDRERGSGGREPWLRPNRATTGRKWHDDMITAG